MAALMIAILAYLNVNSLRAAMYNIADFACNEMASCSSAWIGLCRLASKQLNTVRVELQMGLQTNEVCQRNSET